MTERLGREYPSFNPVVALDSPEVITPQDFISKWGFANEGIRTKAFRSGYKAAVWIASRISEKKEVPVLAAIVRANESPAPEKEHWYFGLLEQDVYEKLIDDKPALASEALIAAEHGPANIFNSCSLLESFVEPPKINLKQNK